MEAAPHLENIENPDLQPDLLEAYADQELTLFGVTGTITDLATMCPRDLATEPIELKNEFVIKALNESGAAIAPDHEALFTKVIEAKGMDKKFTVKELAPESDAKDRIQQSPSLATTDSTATRRSKLKSVTSSDSKEPLPASPQSTGSDERNDQYVHSVERRAKQVAAFVVGNTLAARVVNLASTPSRSPLTPRIHEVNITKIRSESQVLEPTLTVAKIATAPPINERRVSSSFMQLDADTGVHDNVTTVLPAPKSQVSAINDLPDRTAPFIVAVPDNSDYNWTTEEDPTPKEAASEAFAYASVALADQLQVAPPYDWLPTLYKDPMAAYEDFATAIESFSVTLEAFMAADVNEFFSADSSPLASGAEQLNASPPIMGVVSERLFELSPDEKSEVAPLLQNIIGAIHGIHVLESNQASDEPLAATKEQLEAMCVILFDALAVEYDDADLADFLLVLLHSAFRPTSIVNHPRLNTEEAGTREAKRDPVHASGSGSTAHWPLEQLLGKIVLLFSGRSDPVSVRYAVRDTVYIAA